MQSCGYHINKLVRSFKPSDGLAQHFRKFVIFNINFLLGVLVSMKIAKVNTDMCRNKLLVAFCWTQVLVFVHWYLLKAVILITDLSSWACVFAYLTILYGRKRRRQKYNPALLCLPVIHFA